MNLQGAHIVAAVVLSFSVAGPQLVTALARGQRPLTLSVSPASIHPGDVVRIFVRATADERIAATVFDQRLSFAFEDSKGGWTALAGVDLETTPGAYDLRIERDSLVTTHTLRVVAKTFRVRRLRVAEAFVNPPAHTLEQIASDQRSVAEAYARNTPQWWNGVFILPVSGSPTSNFGTRSYYNGQPRAPHAGIDFMSAPGTPVYSPNHGIVALAAPLYFTGNTVIIDHGGRLLSVLAHLSEFDVGVGDVVAPQTVVGLVGATGRVTGPHLHWSVRLNGARVDPVSLIAATGG
jgi:murein DD-endopeptidase MepM/ murein hydrolase activator NlpD